MPRSETLPDNTFRLDGRLSVEDARSGIAVDVAVTGFHTEGDRCASAWLELSRYAEHHAAGSEPVRVAIGAAAFVTLADALFDPAYRHRPITPIILSGGATTSVDGKAEVAHRITERVDDAGAVTVTVEGEGGRVVDWTLDEPAVAGYLHRKAYLVDQLARRDTAPPTQPAESPAAFRKLADGWVRCPMYHYPADHCTEALCDGSGLVHPAAVTARLGPWITPEDVRAELGRIPSSWQPDLLSDGYWDGERAARLAGTSEDGRVEGNTLRLLGLGWGKRYAQPGSLPDGPCIDLWPRDGTHHRPETDLPIEWCAYLPGDPVHGGSDTVGEAIDAAVSSIGGRVGVSLMAAAT